MHRRIAVELSRLVDFHFDILFGTDTRTKVENIDLTDVASASLARGIRYEPTRAIPFRRAMRAARIPKTGTFVDIGSGKGRVCMLAALHGFQRVVGIDYSPGLCRVAERNLEQLRKRTGMQFEAGLHAIDATEYAFEPDDSVVYLFNPFDAEVLAAVMSRLRRSIATDPRDVWIVYHHPTWADIVARDFARVGEWTFGGCRFAVYRYEATARRR